MWKERDKQWGRLTIAVAASLFVLGFLAAPWWRRSGAAWLDLCFTGLCHQRVERSLGWDGVAFAVCARCMGLYLGGWLAIVLHTVRRGRISGSGWTKRVFLLATVPTFIDAVLPFLGLPQLPEPGRLFLALPAGFVCGVFLFIGIEDLWSEQSMTGVVPQPGGAGK